MPAVLEQKVTGREAWRAWRLAGPAVRRAGARSGRPGPGRPAGRAGRPDLGAGCPSWDWHRAGVDLSRSRTVGHRRRPRPAGSRRWSSGRRPRPRPPLRTLPGVGVWTAAEVGQRALGDADAVSVGDFHLASLVGWALVGEQVDDDAMLELLEPYRGHRYRVHADDRAVRAARRRAAARGTPGVDYRAM